jgi:hypothetical protein
MKKENNSPFEIQKERKTEGKIKKERDREYWATASFFGECLQAPLGSGCSWPPWMACIERLCSV